jgi:hypothetical protein
LLRFQQKNIAQNYFSPAAMSSGCFRETLWVFLGMPRFEEIVTKPYLAAGASRLGIRPEAAPAGLQFLTV